MGVFVIRAQSHPGCTSFLENAIIFATSALIIPSFLAGMVVLPAMMAFGVPYRQLVPKAVDNLLVAGRCLGAPDSIDTFRLIGPCFMTGQAAGVAAALNYLKETGRL